MAASRVAIVRCDGYDTGEVCSAVHRGLALLGGAEQFVRPGERILLKPNFLSAARAEDAVTTHPAVFEAVALELMSVGAILSYGDSPGFGRTETVARRSGIAEAAEKLGVELADFTEGRKVEYSSGVSARQFVIANAALDADGIVSLPKLKSHGLTRMTGAIKNQFGCVPGFLKGETHARIPDINAFSRMLVDLNLFLRPRLYVLDAVLAMEGNGPRNGDPRWLNVLVLGSDPVAVDATACRIIGIEPHLVPPVKHGNAMGLGTSSEIEYVGDAIEGFVTEDFKVNRSSTSTTPAYGVFSSLAKRFTTPRPVIDAAACTSCGTCVTVCPAEPKAVDYREGAEKGEPPRHYYDRCIRCYCCQELCPFGAISVTTPLLGRVFRR
ncbi:MAG: DUF362 domain-containing protein [Coriobacteriia bacterium]